MSRAVGIDLGTTYTAIAVIDEHGRPTIVKNSEGQSTTPSAVYIDHPHYIVGEVAIQSTLTEPERVVQFVKRTMGVADHRIAIEGRTFSPEFISSIILRKVIQEASDALGEPIESAVITVPAYFSEAQRQATYDAGQLAGLNVLLIINEPTAAALSYGITQNATPRKPAVPSPIPRQIMLGNRQVEMPRSSTPAQGIREINYRGHKITLGSRAALAVERESLGPASALPALNETKPRLVLVYDLGGGTFDATILAVSPQSLDVVAVGGEPQLGGKDFDDCIMNFVEDQFAMKYGVALPLDASLEAELRLKAEGAKKQLSSRPSVPLTFKARVHLPGDVSEKVIPVRIEMSRLQFENITADFMRRTQLCLENLLEKAGLNWDDIDDILCVGGSSKMPMVRELLTRMAGRAPHLHDPDECIAKGAALQAAIILQEGSYLKNIKVNHVLPHTLGIATLRGENAVIEPIVPALTPLPCNHAREEFTTTLDGQLSVSVLVFEGESRDPNAYPQGPIGRFQLDTSPPRPKGVPKIRVEFKCDENARIIAVARDQDTGKESRAYISLGSSRTDLEMLAEATYLSEAIVA